MTDQENDGILAKWAGFTQTQRYAGLCWDTPQGEALGISPPDFTHSLDAQAKWIIPKACYEYGDIVVYELLSGLMLAGEFTAEACAEAVLSLIGEQVPA